MGRSKRRRTDHPGVEEIQYTFVTTNFKSEHKRYVSHTFNIFPEVYLERAQFPTDPIETCTVTLARPSVASLQEALRGEGVDMKELFGRHNL